MPEKHSNNRADVARRHRAERATNLLVGAPADVDAARDGSELRGIPPAEAIDAWLEACGRPRLQTERVPITAALGRVTAEPIWALRSSPAFPAAAMDRIAVNAAETAGAGRSFATLAAAASRGRHVRRVGEDVAAGELLLAPGERLRPVDVALAAAGGVMEVTVRRRALVSILPTGDELRPAGARPAPRELTDANSLMIEAQAREAGCATHRTPIVPADPDSLAHALYAAAVDSDLVVLVAGTRAAGEDNGEDIMRRCGRVAVRGVAMRPGHAVVLGAVEGVPVMGCPGSPVSAALAFDALALPLLAALAQSAPERRPTAEAHLASAVRSMSGSREQLRVRLGIVDGRRVAVPMRRGASVLSSLAHADALLTLPADRDGLCAGAPVEAELLRPRIDRTVLLAGAPDRALDLLALALDEPTRLAFCEMAPDAAIALVRDGGCHAALFAGPLDDPDAQLVAVRLAEIEVALAVADDEPACAIRAGARIAVGPRGTPARRMLPAAARAGEIVEARSDAAALAAVAAGHAECAVGALDAARRTGLRTASLGRAPLDLVVRRDAADRDPAVRLLLELTDPQTKENTTP